MELSTIQGNLFLIHLSKTGFILFSTNLKNTAQLRGKQENVHQQVNFVSDYKTHHKCIKALLSSSLITQGIGLKVSIFHREFDGGAKWKNGIQATPNG